MTPNTLTPAATAPAATPTYYVRDGGLHRKGGTCDCKVACTEVVTVKHVAHLMAQNAALLAQREELLGLICEAVAFGDIEFDTWRGFVQRCEEAIANASKVSP